MPVNPTSTIKHAALLAASLLLGTLPATYAIGAEADPAPGYPAKPIKLIIPFAPGAGTDLTARTVGAKLQEKWGQQVIADNRTGAGGTIGVDMTAKAEPDGYTICLISASNTVGAATNPNLPYDLTRDLQGLSQATSLFYVLYIHPSVPARNVAELITYARANPGKINFGSSGNNTLQHFSGEMFNHLAKVKMVHVPFKGTAAVIPAMLSGDVQLGFGSLIGVRAQIQQGKLRGLAITATKRSPSVDLPSLAEALPGFEVDQWYGLITGAKVPQNVVRKLNAAIVEAVHMPDVVGRLAADGSTPVGSSPEQFNGYIRSEITKWKRLVQEAKIQLTND